MSTAEEMINAYVQPNDPKNFNPTLQEMKKRAEFLNRITEKGLINAKSGASLALRENGQANISASIYSHVKLDPNGTIAETSMLHTLTTNRFCLNMDETITNRHKLNPRFYELSNFCYVMSTLLGGLLTNGQILVRTYDTFLEQYMLTSRLTQMPLFGQQLKTPIIHEGLKISDPSYLPDETKLVKSSDYTAEENGGITIGGGIYEYSEDEIIAIEQEEGKTISVETPSRTYERNSSHSSSSTKTTSKNTSKSSGTYVGYQMSTNLAGYPKTSFWNTGTSGLYSGYGGSSVGSLYTSPYNTYTSGFYYPSLSSNSLFSSSLQGSW